MQRITLRYNPKGAITEVVYSNENGILITAPVKSAQDVAVQGVLVETQLDLEQSQA